ncbi:S8 family serine peptidase [Desulfoferrobacter suflitae]|uniref:S8 family serine peptidase n=1 Tax=Desulfoferrobacter suflitae TaxID=2865782 RepID=UPI0021642432|nr:S8 family serine peptidase [Desulfoferrobacter suflitae]MCK8600797.1 S8 family serine peptidase [Desulfoferrobacter suflitae]
MPGKKDLCKKFGRLIIILWLPLWLGIAAGGASAQAGTVDPELQKMLDVLGPNDELPVIVKVADDVGSRLGPLLKLRRAEMIQGLKERAERSQKDFRAFVQRSGVKKLRTLWLVNSLSFTVKAGLIPVIARYPKVDAILLDETIRVPETTFSSASAVEWNIELTGAPAVWSLGYSGEGVVVAGMDTGVDVDHPDLTDRWRGGTNSWYDPNEERVDRPYDADGHGTQVMGLLVGGDAGGSSIGMAPGARWIAVKIFNDAGEASDSAIHLGFQWLLDPDGDPLTDDAPHVVNNSWGLDRLAGQCEPKFQEDVQLLKAAGIGVVFAAGNAGPTSASSVSPANYPESLAVGAIDNALVIALSSSRGPSACDEPVFPQLVAPGVMVRTSYLTNGGNEPNSYTTATGTSFAAPHVTGALALLKSAFPEAAMADLEAVLIETARDLGTKGPDNDYGYGLIDVYEAFYRMRGDRGLTAALYLLLLSD